MSSPFFYPRKLKKEGVLVLFLFLFFWVKRILDHAFVFVFVCIRGGDPTNANMSIYVCYIWSPYLNFDLHCVVYPFKSLNLTHFFFKYATIRYVVMENVGSLKQIFFTNVFVIFQILTVLLLGFWSNWFSVPLFDIYLLCLSSTQ